MNAWLSTFSRDSFLAYHLCTFRKLAPNIRYSRIN
jgi:hypothetical protein